MVDSQGICFSITRGLTSRSSYLVNKKTSGSSTKVRYLIFYIMPITLLAYYDEYLEMGENQHNTVGQGL